jgi:hypothetical protein
MVYREKIEMKDIQGEWETWLRAIGIIIGEDDIT